MGGFGPWVWGGWVNPPLHASIVSKEAPGFTPRHLPLAFGLRRGGGGAFTGVLIGADGVLGSAWKPWPWPPGKCVCCGCVACVIVCVFAFRGGGVACVAFALLCFWFYSVAVDTFLTLGRRAACCAFLFPPSFCACGAAAFPDFISSRCGRERVSPCLSSKSSAPRFPFHGLG